jgi:hypothetical protein
VALTSTPTLHRRLEHFSRCFIANFQSLFDKLAQPWDLKSIRHQNDETL